jgi:hypothetical protein
VFFQKKVLINKIHIFILITLTMKKQIFLLFLFFITFIRLQSQIAGSFTVPGSFPTLAAAINTLNLTGVAGPVTINVMAGHTETVPVGGLKLINPAGSNTTTIVFKKSGIGSNPLLMAYSGGTATQNSNQKDGIWMLVDCHNVTIDAIDLIDQNSTAPAYMEFGYGFYKNTGGAYHDTIRNCVITLAAPNAVNSRGIELSCSKYAINTQSAVPTSSLQTNSFNAFHNNLIKNCDVGIWMNGYGMSSYSYFDRENDIGGLSAVTGNTITNFGTNTAIGIYAINQYQLNASFNVINSGITQVGVTGMSIHGPASVINSNTITLASFGNVNSRLVGISQNGNPASTGTVNIQNNIFPSLTYSSTVAALNHSVIAVDQSDNVLVSNNQIGNFTSNTGSLTIISVAKGISGGNNSVISNNSISGATLTAPGSITGIFCSSDIQQITNNSLGNFLAASTSTNSYKSIYGINSPSGSSIKISDNSITNLYGSDLRGISLTSTISPATYTVMNNQIANFAIAPTSTVGSLSIGILATLPSTTAGSMTVFSNTVSNIVASKIGNTNQGGSVYGIWSEKGVKAFVYRNKVYDVSSSGISGVTGVKVNAVKNYIHNNLVGGLDISSTGPVSVLNLTSINSDSSWVRFNSFNLNASASTNTVGTTLISAATNAIVELKNNILVNRSPNGIPSIISCNNILSTSNNNAFYFGTVGLIRTSTPSTSVIAGYQSLTNSDAQSFVENPHFASTVGSDSNFLNIDASIPTQIESGAVAISTITTDFINTPRGTPPDVGAWEGSYTQADATSPVLVNSGFIDSPCGGTRTFTANITDVSGVATASLAPRLYYRINFGLYTSTQGTLVSGSSTNGIWSFTLNYTANINDVIWHFLVSQDVSYLNNVHITPATGASVTDVNTVNVPPNPASNYAIQICTGLIEVEKQTLKLWPNPTNGNLYVSQDGQPNELYILIKDITGRNIIQDKTNLTLSHINLSGYANGVYFVEIYADDAIVLRSKLILSQ